PSSGEPDTGEPDARKRARPVREGAVGNLRKPVAPVVRRRESQQGAGRLLHRLQKWRSQLRSIPPTQVSTASEQGPSPGQSLVRTGWGGRPPSPGGRAAEHATLRSLAGPPRQVQRPVRRDPPRRALLIPSLTSVRRGPMQSTRAASIALFRLRGGHDTGWPAPPSQPPMGNIVHPEFGKLCLVLPGGPNVGDHQPTARTQPPHRFADCFLPAGTPADVVDRQTGENHIKAVVLKGQRREAPRVQFAPIRHSLG